MVTGFFIEVAQLLIIALGAPLLVGVIRQVKARLQGRRGASIWQPFRDLRKLLVKEVVISENTSWIFRFTPYLLAATMLLCALIVPVLTALTPLGWLGNIIVLMYLFLLGTFFLALAGLDAGSAFGGMGASREMAIAALAEPTVMIAIFAIALRAGTTSLDGIIARSAADPLLILNAGHLLAFAAFFIVALAETGRLPVDNPATHLELTMIHEAMILEYSGRHLALIEWASAMKLFLFLTLLANLFMPWGVATSTRPEALVLAFFAFALKVLVLGIGIALLETAVAKLRLFRVPELLSGSFTLALLAVITFFLCGEPIMSLNIFTNLTNLFAFASLGAVFALILRNSLNGQVQMFTLQSALLAILAAVVAVYAESVELFAVAVALAIVKGGMIPYVLYRAVKRIGIQPRVSPYLGTVATLVISGGLIIVAYYVMTPIVASGPLPTASAIPLAFAGILIGLFVTVIRRRALTQILGFLMLENSIFLLALLTTYGVPFIVELGVFLDVLVAVLIMEVFIYRIKENFDTLDVGQMGELKG